MKILLVEDSPTTATLTSAVLRLNGYDVEIVGSVALLRLRLRGTAPDAVVIDWILEDGDAGDVLLEVCGTWPAARILILTAVTALELPPIPSMVTVLFKPCPMDLLMGRLSHPNRKGPNTP